MNPKQAVCAIAAVGVGFCVLYFLMIKSQRRALQRQRRDMRVAQAEWENEGGTPSPA